RPERHRVRRGARGRQAVRDAWQGRGWDRLVKYWQSRGAAVEMLGVGLIITLLLAAWMGWRWYEHRRRPAPGAEEMILVIGPAEVTVISPTPVVEIDPPTVPVEVIGPIPVPVLGRQPRGAWDEKGWSRSVER